MKKRRCQIIKILATSLIIELVLGSTGCSFAIGFNIKNLSNQTITVTYSLKDVYDGLSPRLVKKNVEKNTKYVPIPEDRISIDTKNRVVELKLLPNEEVELFWTSDKSENEYEKEFNITKLRISSAEGTTDLEGREVFKSFRPIKNSWYTFGPEIVGFVLEYR